MRSLAAFLILLTPTLAQAWSACGHHVVALIAYDRLTEDEQVRLRELLAEHPRYAEDFDPPAKVNNPERWRVGLSGYWPDVARGTPYDRPTWHYQLGATLVIGDKVEVPDTPGPLPAGATLDTKELHVARAIKLCRRVMANRDAPPEDRAVALCWLAHLVGDSHQPCHAGSLYAAEAFPRGDRGGNSIEVHNGRNLHALWDGLLGRSYFENRVRREVFEINDDDRYVAKAEAGADNLDPMEWLEESREYSRRFAYTAEVLAPIRAVAEGKAESVPTLQLSEEYLKRAGTVARIRVIQAGYRLAEVWREGLVEPKRDLSKYQLKRPRPKPEPKPARIKVWVTDTGEKYHREDCRFCDKSGVPIDLSAVRGRMEPCKVCKPPR